MIRVKINENNIFTLLTRGSWLLLAVMTCASLVFGSAGFTLGVLAGGLIAIINCYWLYSILKRSMQLPAGKAAGFVRLRYFSRMILIAAIVALLIIYSNVNIFALLLGLSVLVLNILGLTIYMLLNKGG